MAQGRPPLDDINHSLMTEVELTIMKAVWRLESATVKDVTSTLPTNENRKLTTVATMLKILADKGFLRSERVARSLLYFPRVSLVEYQQTALRELSRRLFDDSSAKMFEVCLAEFDFDEHELNNLARLIEARRGI